MTQLIRNKQHGKRRDTNTMNLERNLPVVAGQKKEDSEARKEMRRHQAYHHCQDRIEEKASIKTFETMQKASTWINTSQSISNDDFEDENDIPPWHKANDDKPAWLLDMLAQAAEKEDASDVYKRYRSVPTRTVKKKVFRNKQRSSQWGN